MAKKSFFLDSFFQQGYGARGNRGWTQELVYVDNRILDNRILDNGGRLPGQRIPPKGPGFQGCFLAVFGDVDKILYSHSR